MVNFNDILEEIEKFFDVIVEILELTLKTINSIIKSTDYLIIIPYFLIIFTFLKVGSTLLPKKSYPRKLVENVETEIKDIGKTIN